MIIRSASSTLYRWCAKAAVSHKNSVDVVVQRRSLAHLMDRAISLRKQAVEREAQAALRSKRRPGNSNSGSNGSVAVNNDGVQNWMDSECSAMEVFDEIDLNGDGVISREEFLIAVEKMRHLDLNKMKRALECNDISFNHKASVLGRQVLITNKFDAWKFMGSLPEYKYVSDLCPPVALEPKLPTAPEYTLVLDMDETLLHCSPEASPERSPPDHEFRVNFQGKNHRVYSWLRPHLHEFLDKVANKFEIVIFTASQSAYANEILDIIDPDKKYFHHRLFRESCIEVEGACMKDLKVLGRDLSKTMLVDNSPHVFGYHVDNGIPIESWYPEEKTDNELEKLEWFLRELHQGSDDVRQHIHDKFQVQKLIDETKLQDC